MKILLLSTAYNSISRRIHVELNYLGYDVSVELALDEKTIREAFKLFKPKLTLCPLLMTRIPEDIWRKHKCIIVHPGIIGDRGPSSLDWAIMENQKEWGVTLMEASREYDAGAIWAWETFPMRQASKSNIYRDEVAIAATKAAVDTVRRFEKGNYKPVKLNYQDPAVKGTWHPFIKQADRRINWQQDSTNDIIRKIHSADSQPGVLDSIYGEEFYLYGAHAESELWGKPGEIIAKRNGAICRATKDSAVWITHLKKKASDRETHFKIPAAMALDFRIKDVPEVPYAVFHPNPSQTFIDIWYEEKNNVGYLYFEFYNGAMCTEQCERLRNAYEAALLRRTKVLVLMGGRVYWSNGIHLNVIEASQDPAGESWRNINAIDDLILSMIRAKNHVTISALMGSAGAGGVPLALASDLVFAAPTVIFSPFYKPMGNLYGSEYWTYLLPRRVGKKKAFEMADTFIPVGVQEARRIGMIDDIVNAYEGNTFRQQIGEIAEGIANGPRYNKIIEAKARILERDQKKKPLAQYRFEELEEMKINFWGYDKQYHHARESFVYKLPPRATPLYLARHRLEKNPRKVKNRQRASGVMPHKKQAPGKRKRAVKKRKSK